VKPLTDLKVRSMEAMAQDARQRVIDGKVDASGRENPDGPRAEPLTEAQWLAYRLYLAQHP
jgi:hypothetical protein